MEFQTYFRGTISSGFTHFYRHVLVYIGVYYDFFSTFFFFILRRPNIYVCVCVCKKFSSSSFIFTILCFFVQIYSIDNYFKHVSTYDQELINIKSCVPFIYLLSFLLESSNLYIRNRHLERKIFNRFTQNMIQMNILQYFCYVI